MSHFYGYQTDLILCDAMTIGNGSVTAVDKDTGDSSISGAAGAMLEVGSAPAELRIHAHTDLTIPQAASFNIELETYSSDAHSSAAGPFRNSSTGYQAGARFVLLAKATNDAAVSFKAGDLMTSMIIPSDLLRDRRFLQLRVRTDADLGSASLDAFIRPVV
jgi:hypothetical protein